MIRNPNDIRDGEKKIRMLIAGYPGIGKSTSASTALSRGTARPTSSPGATMRFWRT